MSLQKKYLVKYLSIFLLIYSIFLCINNVENIKISDAESNKITAEIVMEKSTCRVLKARNVNEKMFMASTTKILTAITVIENCNLNDVVTITKDCVGIEGSSIYLEVGEKLSVKDLLFGLMLRSGNDTAVTLALHCSKSIESFAELMNKTAEKIGTKNSNFTNPHGLHDDNHYTTAYDLALISCYAMKNNDFREIVSTQKVQIPHTTREYNRVLFNKNKMLKEFDGATGIKTGYTKKAGRCLVSSALRNGMELVSVVLNCGPMWEESKSLLNECFTEYTYKKVLESDNVVDFVLDTTSNKQRGLYVKNDVYLPLTDSEIDKLEIHNNYNNIIEKDKISDDLFGSIDFKIGNQLIFSEKVYIM